MNLFECKVSYDKMLENGVQKKVTESYLVDSLSFTEAEARIIEEVRPFISGEFTVSDIKRSRISEIYYNEYGDRFYRAKICFVSLNEKTGLETRKATSMLVEAVDIKSALDGIEKCMENTMSDYVIQGIAESPILAIYPY